MGSFEKYFDYNATSPLLPQVAEAMSKLLESGEPLNASSVHSHGRNARHIVESARAVLKRAMSASKYHVLFTSSGTEANAMALHALDVNATAVSAVEHHSVLQNMTSGHSTIIPVNSDGIIDCDRLKAWLEKQDGTVLVSVMFANNETGVIQPVKEVVELVHRYQGYVHVDAAQALGKVDVNCDELQADFVTVSAHKIGGPQGAAALVVRKSLDIRPLYAGGGQEMRKRSGTENVVAIHGFGTAASLIDENKQGFGNVAFMRDHIQSELVKLGGVCFGANVNRLPNTLNIAMPGVEVNTQLIHFDLNGFALSAGSACSSGSVSGSHVLKAMGIDDELAKTAIRISMRPNTKDNEVENLIECWKLLAAGENVANGFHKVA